MQLVGSTDRKVKLQVAMQDGRKAACCSLTPSSIARSGVKRYMHAMTYSPSAEFSTYSRKQTLRNSEKFQVFLMNENTLDLQVSIVIVSRDVALVPCDVSVLICLLSCRGLLGACFGPPGACLSLHLP